jgi:hypothetical protein
MTGALATQVKYRNPTLSLALAVAEGTHALLRP